MFFDSWPIFDDESGSIEIQNFNFFSIHWNKIWIEIVKAKGVAFEYLLWLEYLLSIFPSDRLFELKVLEHFKEILNQNDPKNENLSNIFDPFYCLQE